MTVGFWLFLRLFPTIFSNSNINFKDENATDSTNNFSSWMQVQRDLSMTHDIPGEARTIWALSALILFWCSQGINYHYREVQGKSSEATTVSESA